jgi:hypothetical protein
VIGKDENQWYCQHDCPGGDKPGPIAKAAKAEEQADMKAPDQRSLRPILEFMLQQIDKHIAPPVPDSGEVELVSLGLHPSEWRPSHAAMNSRTAWHQT